MHVHEVDICAVGHMGICYWHMEVWEPLIRAGSPTEDHGEVTLSVVKIFEAPEARFQKYNSKSDEFLRMHPPVKVEFRWKCTEIVKTRSENAKL